MCDEYQGWVNRETWALHLWLTNDYDLYMETRSVACVGDDAAAAGALQEWVEQDLWWRLVETHDGRNLIWDVGSLWRVDWHEIAQAVRE